MEEEQKFCKNCKRNVAAVNFVLHIAYCERKIQLCQLCGEPAPRSESEFDAHLKEYHILEDCNFCKLPIEKWKLDSHQADQCYKRLVNCKYCDLSRTFDTISEHEESCGSRTDECSFCKARFLLKEMEAHLGVCPKNNVLKTQMLCSYCESKFPVENYGDHVRSCVFRSEECLKCGDRVKLKDLKEHGDFCGKENRQSSYFCEHCEQKFSWKEFQSHQLYCRARFRICRQCHESVQMSELDHHLEICQKVRRRESEPSCQHCGRNFPSNILKKHETSCEFRPEKCPYCHDFVTYKNMKMHMEVCGQVRKRESEPSCQHCEKHFPSNILENHETSCGFRPEKCPNCYEVVNYKDMKKHMEVCGQIGKRESEPSCKHCGKHFPSNILENHETNCGFRPEKCPNCYDVVAYKDMKKHMEVCGQIGKRESESSCQHCKKSFPSDVLENHETSCGFRSAKCPNFYDVVAYKDRKKHMEICGQIRKRESEPSCQHCKKSFPSNVLENHETSCGFRSAKCPNCYDDVAYKDRKKHMEICGQIRERESEPSCEHCGKHFPSNILENHETSCGFRPEKCSNCSDFVAYKDMKRHMEVCGEESDSDERDSDERPVSCEYCNKTFALSYLAYHMNHCPELIEKCPSCDFFVKMKDKYNHKETCMALRNESELCEHCGKTFPSNILENHKSNCDLRCEKCAFCYEYVKYKDLEHHKELCGQVKQYPIATCKDCDRRIPTEMMEEHQSTCDFQKCPLCNSSVEIKDMDIHLNICEETKKYPKATCEHCGSKIPVNKLDDHEFNCDFHCKTCPLCKVAVKVKDIDNHRSICEQKQKCQSKVECEHCGFKIPFKHIEEHGLNCGFRLEKCSLCYDIFKLMEMDGHRRECEKINLPQMPATCPYCELEFPSNELEYHVVSCGASIKKCLTCERMFKLMNFNGHECLQNIYGSQDEDLTKNDIEQALEIESDEHPVPCEYCFETFPLNCLSLHMETCQELSEKCQSCNATVKFKDKYKHQETCMKPCDRLTKCPFCSVKFRSESLLTHLETCTERIENCKNCDLPVMLRDKGKHMESCKQESAKEECGICFLLVPKDELSEHFSKCIVKHSDNPYSECGMSTPRPIASCTDDSKVIMHSEVAKTNLYPSMGDLLLCPYCSLNYPPKRFSNHKKYCKSALVECPICKDTYHIEEKEEHGRTCDALDTVLLPESDLKLELQNKFGTLHSEENLRKIEVLNETCPFCSRKIPEPSYNKHLQTCSQSMKQCRLCKEEFPKETERDHLNVCPKVIADRDEFLYPGFSENDSKAKDFDDTTVRCNSCKKYIPIGAIDSHLTQCCTSKKCPYCNKSWKGNVQTHLAKCNDYKKTQQKSLLNQNTGAKPKNRNSEETSTFYRITGAVKSLFSGSEKANPSHSMDSQTNMYPANANYNENLVAPPDEIMYVSCEFCGKDILMDQEAIAVHESGCRPDLVSLPSAVSDEHKLYKSAHEAYSYSDQASALQRERRYLERPEGKKVTPDDVSCETETYNYMKNFKNRYDPKDISYQENLEVEATKGNLGSEINDTGRSCDKYIVEDANTWDYKESRSMSKCPEKKYESKYSTVESNDEYPENVLGSQENNEINEDSDVYEAISYLRRSKISTEPGEFLKNNLDCKQFDLRLSKKREQLSSDSTDNSDVRNKDKLYNSWQEIDARRAEAHYKNNHNERDKPIHNNRKKVVSTEGRKSERIANQTNLNISENVGVIGKKSSSNKVMNKNASPYSDNYHHNSDPESSKEDNSDYKNKTVIHSSRKNVTSSKSDKRTSKSYSSKDYKKDLNAFHSTYSSTKVLDENISADDPLYDSDPESCKEMKDSNAYDYSYTKNKAERIKLDTESGKHSDHSLFKSKASIIFSSEMKGPVKIDRLRRRSAERQVNEYSEHFERNKQLTDCHAKESLYPDVSTFPSGDTLEKSSQEKLNDMYLKGRQRSAKAGIDNNVLKSADTYEKGSNERLYDMYLKESQQTTKADIDHMFKNSSYKQYFESNAKKDEPMETDDENNIVGKHTSIPTDYFHHSRMYADVSDFETKDSNMDSYFEFLKNEKDDFPDVCKRCGNEMCVCNIEKSLSIAGEKGTFQRNADQLRYIEEQRKAHGQASDYRYLKAKSSVDDRKANNQQDDRWKKYRPSLEDSL